MKTSVIGLGTIGATVARLLAAGGMDVMVAERNTAKAQALAESIGPHATAVTIDQAVKDADVVVLAIWFDSIKQFLLDHRAALTGKVLVDPSNPIESDGKGGVHKTLPQEQSSGALLARLIPEGTEIVKAFGTLGGPSLAALANRKPEKAVLFYATDDPEAGRAVETLIRASGYEPVKVGGIDQSLRLEVFGDLHEMGKLGKAVSRAEAEALLGVS